MIRNILLGGVCAAGIALSHAEATYTKDAPCTHLNKAGNLNDCTQRDQNVNISLRLNNDNRTKVNEDGDIAVPTNKSKNRDENQGDTRRSLNDVDRAIITAEPVPN